jgi:Xaa-Pro aminopeptidase
MLEDLNELMAEYEVDVLFLEGKSIHNPDLYYMSRFLAADDFFLIKQREQPITLAANDMVCERAKKYSSIKDFHSLSPTRNQAISERRSREELERQFIENIANNLIPGNAVVGIPRKTDAQYVQYLLQLGIEVKPVQDLFFKARETKDPTEIRAINKASRATEVAFHEVVEIIQNSEVGANRILSFNKSPLTVGRIKQIIEHSLIENASESDEELIVAGGKKSADYHYLGRAQDKLRANEPIIVDIFPRRVEDRYHADITRTLVRGHVSKQVSDLFESVEAAMDAVIDALNTGHATAENLVDAMADSFEKDGHACVNRTPDIKGGMLHFLGHGIGLDVHEYPRLTLEPTPLLPNAVIAIEPALYYPRIGGIRLENDLAVTKKGSRLITKLPRSMNV